MIPSAVYTYRSLCSHASGLPGATLNKPMVMQVGASAPATLSNCGDTLKPVAPTRGRKLPGGLW